MTCFRSIVRRSTALTFLAVLITARWCDSNARANDLRVYDGRQPNDARLAPLKDLNGHFPFDVPSHLPDWEKRAGELRRRIRVATGIWPLPARTPMNAVIHGKVQRDGFTVERVYFESIPNHFVTGLLFRPDDGQVDVKRPAVLCPHGHGGRLQRHERQSLRQMIADGAERFESSGQFPKLARCGQLARMGCVTFIFDMLGYADSNQISHHVAHRMSKRRSDFEGQESWGLFSAQAEMRLQSVMGMQTWNSIRCLDFLQQLPDVDDQRIAVTGGSGGGTQTILLCAIDPRPIAAFPNGMVSTSMQGGCTCENCSLLRIGTGNVELAALFAPKPQGMTAAEDWTRDMMTDGYPQLQQLYGMYGCKENVYCRELLHFPHNYNYVTRATMYAWFNEHLQLGVEAPPLEEDFELLSDAELTVWNEEHPQPPGGDEYERATTRYLAEESDKQIASLTPTDPDTQKVFHEIIGGALKTIIGRDVPDAQQIERTNVQKQPRDGYLYFEDIVRLESRGEELPVVSLYPTRTPWNGDVVLWVDGRGKQSLLDAEGELDRLAATLLKGGASIVAADLFGQGEFLADGAPITQQRVVPNPREVAAYTYCYNHTLFARRVHDVLTLVSFIRDDEHQPKRLLLVAGSGSGPVAVAARAIAGSAIDRAAIDTQGFRFAAIDSYRDPSFLPGAVKYGDLPTFLALNAPHPLRIVGEGGQVPSIVRATYRATGAEQQATAASVDDADELAKWLLAPQ